MKLKLLTLTALFLSFLFVGCKGESKTESLTILDSQNDVSGIHGLHYLHVNDYSLDELADLIGQQDLSAMCSELRCGDYVVRNLDWFQVDQATYVVRLDETEDRLASMQVCGMQDFIKHDTDISTLDHEGILRAIGGTFDGMNSAGVYIGANVVPYGQMTTDGSQGGDINYLPEGAGSDARQYSTGLLTRLILDKATSLDSAKSLILSNGWRDYSRMVKAGFQIHWLIATTEGSFVCEFVDGKPVFVDASSTKSADLGNIMTNFSNYLFKQGKIQSHGSGYERYKLTQSEYNSLQTLDDFKRMASLLFYSRMYSEDYNAPFYFWTEWSGEFDGGAEEVMAWKDSTQRNGADWETFVQRYQEQNATYDWRKRGAYAQPADPWWYTAHSSIWNLKTKTLVLDMEEQNLFKAEFKLLQ